MITIYQVLPRLYGNSNTENIPGGSIRQNGCGKMNDFSDQVLESIRDFGFSHIWYTGLLEHATQTDYSEYGIAIDHPSVVKGNAGSPYAIKDYYDIDPDLAVDVPKRMKEFEALVKRTHKTGLKMIIDFVPNHVARQYASDAKPRKVKDLGETDDKGKSFSPDNNFYYIPGEKLHLGFSQEEEPYEELPAKVTGNNKFDAYPGINDWYETVKLNYGIDYATGQTHFAPVPDTWEKMTDILLFWAKKGIDAFRCDMAEMVPCEFWAYAIGKVKEAYPHIIFIAEVYNPAEYRNYIHRGGFDYLYDKVGMYDTLRANVCQQAPASNITHCWQSVDDIQSHMLYFLENHDEQRIASDFFAGDARKAFPALVVAACMNTNPLMIYAGQELGERGMDSEGFSGKDGRTSIFDYWSVASLRKLNMGEIYFTPEEHATYGYYRKLLSLRQQNETIKEGAFYDLTYANLDRNCGFNPDRHFAFLRSSRQETLLIVCNFDCHNAHVGIKLPRHAFEYTGLARGMRNAIDLLTGETQTLELTPDGYSYANIPANGAVILSVKGK